ncbi:MAG: hypothetical protein M3144_07450, partial [Actinomycetota bacterium]|nr:hypothetical protein [Actinomycetota bacterium]
GLHIRVKLKTEAWQREHAPRRGWRSPSPGSRRRRITARRAYRRPPLGPLEQLLQLAHPHADPGRRPPELEQLLEPGEACIPR